MRLLSAHDWDLLVQTYSSLGAGNWTFSVRSIDGAGNVEVVTVPFYAWTVTLTAGYPIISGGDSGTTTT